MTTNKVYNTVYSGERNSQVAFPLGGIGAGMFCLEGTGTMTHLSVRHRPEINKAPIIFSAVCIKGKDGNIARVLEGQVPTWKIFSNHSNSPGTGVRNKHYGLPRFEESQFTGRFPFGMVELRDPKLPLEVDITGWSPFVPRNADDSSLPVAGMEYTFTNTTNEALEIVYSFNASHFMQVRGADNYSVQKSEIGQGFVLDKPPVEGKPWDQGAFSVFTDQPQTEVDCAWFRGGWFDPLTMVWNQIESGAVQGKAPLQEGTPSPGGSIYVPLELKPNEKKTIKVMLSWYVPETNQTIEVPEASLKDNEPTYYKPWYAGRFANISEVSDYWMKHYQRLRDDSQMFSDTFFAMSLPDEVIEAAAANLSIIKSPTILRQIDGRLWAWEGSGEGEGSCHGSCTHVWNYAQSIPHLFPELERGFRYTEFNEGQDEKGHQNFRIPLPILPADHEFHAASDGQLGGIMKIYREWRVSGDTEWLRGLWTKVKQSLHFCIESWDPDHLGVLIEPHHNTYDIEFWGPNGMCSSVYLGALKAAAIIADAMGESSEFYNELYNKGQVYLEKELFNGEYFEHKMIWEGLRAESPITEVQAWNVEYSTEAQALLQKEGPKYQYGNGCLSDGLIGAWLAEMCGLGEILDRDKVKSHLLSVYKYNFRHDLSDHANPQRPGYALGHESGLLLCSWPKGGKLSLPFIYSNEVWTGIEYEVAAHLMTVGCIEEGLEIVRACRDRYDGRVRNPYNEYECGHWYARAMASYGLLQAYTGIRYDACDKTLYISPKTSGDFSSFLATERGYGLAGVRDGKPFVDVISGQIDYKHIKLQ